ncbi:ABC transporter ATP-binding protein [Actinomycetota bacterium]|nr:ABC transporter ATP-binding protein [Actinomycetota bacterium]
MTDSIDSSSLDAAFKLEGVKVVRDRKIIVNDINWEVKPQENWVLLGPNGIGKSTIVNIIATYGFPTSGSATVLDKKLGEVDVFELRKRIGILSADFSNKFLNTEKVLDIVRLGKTATLSTWGDHRDQDIYRAQDEEKALQLLNEFGVLKIAEAKWGVLSQGERKRVQMARVLMNDPELLLLDEPTAGLDLAGREYVINTLNRIGSANSSGKRCAIVLVNHQVEEIPPCFDKVAIMASDENGSGVIKYQGDIKSVLTSQNLTNAYKIDLNVVRTANLRYFASSSVIIDQ